MEFSFPMSKRDERLTKSVINVDRPDSMIEGSILVKSFLTAPLQTGTGSHYHTTPSPPVTKKEDPKAEFDLSTVGTLRFFLL